MTKLIPLVAMFLCSISSAVTIIKLEPIGFGKTLQIGGEIRLPNGQKLNHGAPSKIAVYEKENSKWILTKELSLNDFFTLTEMINFQRPVSLKSEKSEIKIEASLYHCPKAGRGICVIDDFEGLISRSSNKVGTAVRLSLAGSPPK